MCQNRRSLTFFLIPLPNSRNSRIQHISQPRVSRGELFTFSLSFKISLSFCKTELLQSRLSRQQLLFPLSNNSRPHIRPTNTYYTRTRREFFSFPPSLVWPFRRSISFLNNKSAAFSTVGERIHRPGNKKRADWMGDFRGGPKILAERRREREWLVSQCWPKIQACASQPAVF